MFRSIYDCWLVNLTDRPKTTLLTQKRRQNAMISCNCKWIGTWRDFPAKKLQLDNYDWKCPREFDWNSFLPTLVHSKLADCLRTSFLMIYSAVENFLCLSFWFIPVSTVYSISPLFQFFFLLLFSFFCVFDIKSIYGHLHEWLTMTIRHYITISFYLLLLSKSRVRVFVPNRQMRNVFFIFLGEVK